ncbi:hypothetical protein V1512DRAFT_260715 [Lipomyces arxii]|uniref:uncharacterized protein n=1 Tax=Lipomyces arxii TaxID=56418 RepID=UPI0034CFE65D
MKYSFWPRIFILRVSQAFIDIVILGVSGWLVSNAYRAIHGYFLFTSIFTALALVYQVFGPRVFPEYHKSIIVLGLEALTFIWWLCAFVSIVPLYFSHIKCHSEGKDHDEETHDNFCGPINSHIVANIWFSLVQFGLFFVTLAMVIRVFRNDRRDNAISDSVGVASVHSDPAYDDPFSAQEYDSAIDGGASNRYSARADQYEMASLDPDDDPRNPYGDHATYEGKPPY